MKPFVFIKIARRAYHTVFVVSDGQKRFFDPVFHKAQPYSSGQQVKRSIMEHLILELQQLPSPVTYVWSLNGGSLSEGEVLSACDPRYADLMFGGWMAAPQGGGERILKRRSPLSISALKPLHPLLASVSDRENITHDRSNRPNNNKVIILERGKGNVPSRQLTDSELAELLLDSTKSLLRKWIPEEKNRRLSGLFVEDIAIDLRTLFAVSLSDKEPEITPAILSELKSEGWIETTNAFGPCLVAPASLRSLWIPALASALLNWRLTSNQANKYSPQDTLAVAISQQANQIGYSIRAKLTDASRTKADMVVDDTIAGVSVFKTPLLEEYIFATEGSVSALDDAYTALVRLFEGYDYEKPC